MPSKLRYAIPLALSALAPTLAAAATGGALDATLSPLKEVPAIQSSGRGEFNGAINETGTEVSWDLTYTAMDGNVTQAHIHFAQTSVNGAIVIYLCSNLTSPAPPAGTPPCPTDDGHLTGSFTVDDMLPVSSQGINAGEFFGFLRSIRTGNTYANVHTDKFPGGEIRGQLKFTPGD